MQSRIATSLEPGDKIEVGRGAYYEVVEIRLLPAKRIKILLVGHDHITSPMNYLYALQPEPVMRWCKENWRGDEIAVSAGEAIEVQIARDCSDCGESRGALEDLRAELTAVTSMLAAVAAKLPEEQLSELLKERGWVFKEVME